MKFAFKFTVILILVMNGAMSAQGYLISGDFLNIDNSRDTFEVYEGKPVLVDAMATWCVPCKTELSHLKNVFDSVNSQLKILSLSIDPNFDSIAKINSFRNDLGFNTPWDWGIDDKSDFMNKVNVEIIPSLYLYNEDGGLVEQWEGITDSDVVLDAIVKNFGFELDRVEGRSGSELILDQLLENQFFQITAGFLAIATMYMVLVPSSSTKVAKT